MWEGGGIKNVGKQLSITYVYLCPKTDNPYVSYKKLKKKITRTVKTLLDYYLCVDIYIYDCKNLSKNEFNIQQILTYHTLQFKSFHVIIIMYLKYVSRLDFTNCNIIVKIGHHKSLIGKCIFSFLQHEYFDE